MVGLSRMYHNKHWASDVALGPSRPRTHRLVGANAAAQGPRLVSPLEGHIVAPAKTTNSSVAAPETLELIDRYWRAANYLSVGQIYLLDNPLLRQPLLAEHVKPRLLGHWGTTPGLNLLYAHMNRAIKERDLNALYVTGPGHGGPGLVANAYLEGTYSEVYASIGQDEDGLRALFRQFSFPGGIPSHVAPETPGSIHEGGELGYALVHAYGAAFDNPDLLVMCVVGDGEAETGPLAASWHSNKFLSPVTDGAVLPVLHLNGYKIANPTVLARIPEDELTALLQGYGYVPHFVTVPDPMERATMMRTHPGKVGSKDGSTIA
jgi:xylulose-5-phosphate/fructose-6-phosphate phosphoketolase